MIYIHRLRKRTFPSKEGLIKQHLIKRGEGIPRKQYVKEEDKRSKCRMQNLKLRMVWRRLRLRTDRGEWYGKVKSQLRG